MDPNEEYLPGFEKIQDPRMEQKLESRTNLIVFGIVILAVLPFLLWGHWFMRTPSEKHFLIGIPLMDFKSLQPVVGVGEPPRSSEFTNKTLLVILWGPWDDASCDLLHKIWLSIQEAQKNPKFQVVPIAYFAHASEPVKWYEMTQEERQHFLSQKKLEENRLGQFVQESFRNGFSFPTVWWDPVDRFRQDLIALSIENDPNHKSLRVISAPTIILAEKGLITKVWTNNSPEDLEEIEETLKIVAVSAQSNGTGKAPAPVPAPAKNP